MEKSTGCVIEYYEIDLREEDWTLDSDSIDEAELASCDLIMCQHLFGLPFRQERLFEVGRRSGVPILEDCVQSGSLFGRYTGDPRSDVVMYSGGLDKTPQCFGAGFGYFRDSHFGNHLYEKGPYFYDVRVTISSCSRWTTYVAIIIIISLLS